MMNEKIFAEEILLDEELNKVAGGTGRELADDSCFLNSLNGSTDRYGTFKATFKGPKVSAEVRKAWKNVGVDARPDYGLFFDNRYYIDGKKVSQNQARQHAMDVTGHQMKKSDWDW